MSSNTEHRRAFCVQTHMFFILTSHALDLSLFAHRNQTSMTGGAFDDLGFSINGVRRVPPPVGIQGFHPACHNWHVRRWFRGRRQDGRPCSCVSNSSDDYVIYSPNDGRRDHGSVYSRIPCDCLLDIRNMIFTNMIEILFLEHAPQFLSLFVFCYPGRSMPIIRGTSRGYSTESRPRPCHPSTGRFMC